MSSVLNSSEAFCCNSLYCLKHQESRFFRLEIMCLVAWTTKIPVFRELSRDPLRVQYTIASKGNLFCRRYCTMSSGSQCLKLLDLCFLVVISIVSCPSTRSVPLLRLLIFSIKTLTLLMVFVEFGSRPRPGIDVIWVDSPLLPL